MENTAKYVWTRLFRFVEHLRHLPRAFALVTEASGRLTTLWLGLLIVQGLLPAATVLLTREAVNSLISAIRAGGTWQSVRPTLYVAIAIGVVLLLQESLTGISSLVRNSQSLRVRDHIADLIQKKSLQVDLSFYDFPDFYDHLHRARGDASYRPLQLIENMGVVLQNGITAVGLLLVLVRYSAVLPLAILVCTLPALYVVVQAGLRRHEWDRRATIHQRRSFYFESVLTERESASEIRLFNIGDYFLEQFQSTRRKLRKEEARLSRKEAVSEMLAGLTAVAAVAAAMAWMTWRAIHGLVSLGDLALFYQAFNQSLTVTSALLGRVGQLYQNALFLGNLFEFLDLQPNILDPVNATSLPQTRLEEGIRFENVAFRYPGQERFALQGLNLELKAGTTIALLGPNGAGKSTLIKLLCRFYDPTGGRITFDGVPIDAMPISELRSRITVMFQSPVQYSETARRNVQFGDLTVPKERLPQMVERASELSGAVEVIEKLPLGYESPLGRRFENGLDLSLGEWQKIALARTFFRGSEIVILDEPTSAMDPWEEARWAKRLQDFAVGRIVLIITHRLTTARFADKIHVMASGKVVESGTHAELLALNGEYQRAWLAQSQR